MATSPPGVYDRPHFGVHFYLEPIEKVFAIESGPRGPERVRCDQFARARLPVPANYIHADFKDVEAAAVALTGRYPTLSSIRYRPTTSGTTVSLEGFEQRAAAPPAR